MLATDFHGKEHGQKDGGRGGSDYTDYTERRAEGLRRSRSGGRVGKESGIRCVRGTQSVVEGVAKGREGWVKMGGIIEMLTWRGGEVG